MRTSTPRESFRLTEAQRIRTVCVFFLSLIALTMWSRLSYDDTQQAWVSADSQALFEAESGAELKEVVLNILATRAGEPDRKGADVDDYLYQRPHEMQALWEALGDADSDPRAELVAVLDRVRDDLAMQKAATVIFGSAVAIGSAVLFETWAQIVADSERKKRRSSS